MAGRGRARTVISPPLPSKAAKPKLAAAERAPYAVRPGVRYRLRLTEPDPFGGGFVVPEYSDDLAPFVSQRDELRALGVGAVAEELRGPIYASVEEAPWPTSS